jgi:hypothetical protein
MTMSVLVAKHSKIAVLCLGLIVSVFLPPLGAGQQSPKQQPKDSSAAGAARKGTSAQEDWTSLTLQGTSLRMKAPVLADKGDFADAGFIRERYQAEWRPKDPFDLYVIRPRGVEKPPVILYLYSYPEDTEQFKNNFWCETAVSGGYAAVGFVGAVTGHRTRYRLMKEWFVSEMQEALGSTVHDVELILDYLGTRKDLDASHVAMFGSGSGGAIAILASAGDPRIRAIDLLGPWGDWPKWLAETKIIQDDERARFVKPEFLAGVAPLEPVSWLPKIKAKALRIQDVRGNKSIPDEAQKRLEAAAPDFAVIDEYGNGLAFMAKNRSTDPFQWMKEQLKADSQTRVASNASERIHIYPAVQAPPAEKWPNVGTLDTGKATPATKPKQASDKDKPQGPRDN